MVIVHRHILRASRRKRFFGRVSGPSRVVGRNMFSTMPTGFVVSDAPTGLFTVCCGRQDRGQIDDAELNFCRVEY